MRRKRHDVTITVDGPAWMGRPRWRFGPMPRPRFVAMVHLAYDLAIIAFVALGLMIGLSAANVALALLIVLEAIGFLSIRRVRKALSSWLYGPPTRQPDRSEAVQS